MRWMRNAGLLSLLIVALVAPSPAPAATGEYEVKAAFLLHFAKLVEWPDSALRAGDAITIGVFVDDPFEGRLSAAIKGESAAGRPLRAARVHSIEGARRCQLLFIPASQSGRIEELRSRLGRAPVLVVGETDGFAARGGAINLYEEGGRIRFEVNRRAATRSGLKLSSRLLRLARLVSEGH